LSKVSIMVGFPSFCAILRVISAQVVAGALLIAQDKRDKRDKGTVLAVT